MQKEDNIWGQILLHLSRTRAVPKYGWHRINYVIVKKTSYFINYLRYFAVEMMTTMVANIAAAV